MQGLNYLTALFGGLVPKIASKAGLQTPPEEYHADLERVFDVDNGFFKGKVILILDDIDALQGLEEKQRKILLSQLGTVKRLSAEKKTLLSILALTNVPGQYLNDAIGNSPFNAASRAIAPFFSEKEHKELFSQFERQEGFVIDYRIKDFIYRQTDGAPGLEQIYGCYYTDMWKRIQRPPIYSEWLSEVTCNSFLTWIWETFPNYQHIFDLLNLVTENEKTRQDAIQFLSDLVHTLTNVLFVTFTILIMMMTHIRGMSVAGLRTRSTEAAAGNGIQAAALQHTQTGSLHQQWWSRIGVCFAIHEEDCAEFYVG